MIRVFEKGISRSLRYACVIMSVASAAALPVWGQSTETVSPRDTADDRTVVDADPSTSEETRSTADGAVQLGNPGPEQGPTPTTQFQSLVACEQSHERLVANLFIHSESTTSCHTQAADLQGRLDTCNAEYDMQRRTNIDLNAALEACEQGAIDTETPLPDTSENADGSGAPDADALVARAVAAEELAADRLAALQLAEVELEELRALLERSEISAEPGYSYFGGTASDSYLTLSLVQARDLLGLVPEQTRCAELIEWLREQQTRTDFALTPRRLETWALSPAGPVICSAAVGGAVAVSQPVERGNEEAHLVLFR